MNEENPEAVALIAATKSALARCRAEMAPKMDAAGITDPDMRAANEIQNVLRICLSTCLNETVVMTEELPAQLATRLACYALSALPEQFQQHAAFQVGDALPESLRARVAKGIGIQTKWSPISDGPDTKQ